MNVCYIRVDTIAANHSMATSVVYDAFGGRVYANYMWIKSQNKKFWEVAPSQCEIHLLSKPDETCRTADEFDELTDKYFGVSK